MDEELNAGDQRFLYRAVKYLREEFPKETRHQDDEALRQFVAVGCSQAAAFGMDSEIDAIGFIDLQIRLGDDFTTREDTAWAREVLDDPDMDNELKFMTLRNGAAMYLALQAGA